MTPTVPMDDACRRLLGLLAALGRQSPEPRRLDVLTTFLLANSEECERLRQGLEGVLADRLALDRHLRFLHRLAPQPPLPAGLTPGQRQAVLTRGLVVATDDAPSQGGPDHLNPGQLAALALDAAALEDLFQAITASHSEHWLGLSQNRHPTSQAAWEGAVTEFRLFTQIQDRVTARAHQAPHLVVAGVAADLEVAKWPEDRRAVFYDLVTRDLAERRCAAEAPPESVPGPPHPGPGETQYLSTEAAKATVASGTVQSEPATAKAAGGAEAAEAGGAWAAYRRTLLDASRQLGVRRLRPPFLLREVLDCTAIQAAQALRLSPPVVEHLVAQARQRLPQLPPPPGPRPSPEGVPIFGPVAGTSPKHS